MKKIIVLSLILFFITGCDVTSNITISKNLQVQEEVLMTGTPEFFARFYRNTPLTVVKNQLNLEGEKEILINNGYQYKLVEDSKPYPLVQAIKNYQTIEEFTENTVFKDQYFRKFETIKNDNLITIKASEYRGHYDDEQDRYDIAKFSLNIKVPYVVVENNADSYNEKENIYTWNIKSDTSEKEIILTFDKNERYVYNLGMYISTSVLILIGIIVILIIIYFVKRSKKNNRVTG